MRFGIEAAPTEQGRSPIAFGMAAGMLFQFLFCSFLVSVWRRSHECWLMASFSLLPHRGVAACCGWAGVVRGVEKCRSTVVLWHGFLVQRSKLWQVVVACAVRKNTPVCLHKKTFPVQIFRYSLLSFAFLLCSFPACHGSHELL